MFNFFKKKKTKPGLTESQLKWNKMWDMWASGEMSSLVNELMTYQSEVNNGGHSQYFFNTWNTGTLQHDLDVLYEILSPNHKSNLEAAYNAFLQSFANGNDEEIENILENCDNFFYENEQEINHYLEKYAEKNM